MILFLIPARGGSKGVPNKNTEVVAGVPLVGRAVMTGRLALGRFGEKGRVVCSTDSTEIAEIAAVWGAEVPFMRPAELAGDQARQMDVVLHAIGSLDVKAEDTVVLLQPTSPLVSVDDVLSVIRMHRECRAPVVSVVKTNHPLKWSFVFTREHVLERWIEGEVPPTRQGVREFVTLNGAVYVSTAGQLREDGSFLCEGSRGFIMPEERSIDIDTPADLEHARLRATSRPIEPVTVAGRALGPGEPCLIIAEAGVNHNGSLQLALDLVDAAADAGADAVKFQTFHSEKVVSPRAQQAAYQRRNTGVDESQLSMIKRLQLDDGAFEIISRRCHERGILFLSSPFDEGSVDLLDSLGVAAFKVGSGELTNPLLLAHIASKVRPVILSTGMASMREVACALETLSFAGSPPVILLHCVSNYPAEPVDCNLEAMATMRAAFGTPVGWSDHTLGTHVAVAAVGLGASVVEKHLTLDCSMPGPDHRASLEPNQFKELVGQIRDIEAALGTGEKVARESETGTAEVARRSLHAAGEIAAGREIEASDLTALRPGTGIPARRLAEVVGRVVRRRIRAGEMIDEADLE